MQRNTLFSTEVKADGNVEKYFERFIHWMNGMGNFEKISEQDIQEHFSDTFEYSTNDKINATNVHELYARIQNSKTKYRTAYIHFPIKDLEIKNNEAKASYQVTFVDIDGNSRDDTNTINVNFNKDGKVDKFHQTYKISPPVNDDAETKETITMKL